MKLIYKDLKIFVKYSWCLYLLLAGTIKAQECIPGVVEPGWSCIGAPLVDKLDGFCSVMPEINASGGPVCEGAFFLHNTHWISFIATSTNVLVTIAPSNCSIVGGGIGIQGAITTSCPTGFPYPTIGNCQAACTSNTFTLGTGGYFSIGEQYWILLDGCSGSRCKYEIVSTEGIGFPCNLDTLILRELFYDDLGDSCSLPYRYFYTNLEVDQDSVSYDTTNILVENVNNGWIIRVSPTGLQNTYIRIGFNVNECSFRDSILVRGGPAFVNPNTIIDLYEIKLAGDPSKYIARVRGVASESIARWGYVSKADYSSAYLSSFGSLHYIFLDDLKDTSDYILFADISTSSDTSCFTRYFDAPQGSIFSYRSTLSEPDTSEIEPSINVFPNPGNGVINIKYNGLKTERARITLYTMQGVLVGSYAFSNHDTGDIFRIEENNIAPGIYKLEFHDVVNNIFIPLKYIKQ